MSDNELADVEGQPEAVDVEDAEAQPEPEQVEAEAGETGEEPEPEKQTDEPPKVGEDKELLKKIEKLERRQLYLQRQLEKERVAAQQPPEPKEEILPADAPKESDFDSIEEYNEALIDFKVAKQVAEYTQKQREKELDQAAKAEKIEFNRKLAMQGAEKYSDFEDIALADYVPINDYMVEALRTCENPADVAYHLGQNLNLAASISRMTPQAAAREITKIDLNINPAPATERKPKKEVTQAPPPIRPTKSGNVVTKDPDKMTQAEYEQWRRDGGGRA